MDREQAQDEAKAHVSGEGPTGADGEEGEGVENDEEREGREVREVPETRITEDGANGNGDPETEVGMEKNEENGAEIETLAVTRVEEAELSSDKHTAILNVEGGDTEMT